MESKEERLERVAKDAERHIEKAVNSGGFDTSEEGENEHTEKRQMSQAREIQDSDLPGSLVESQSL